MITKLHKNGFLKYIAITIIHMVLLIHKVPEVYMVYGQIANINCTSTLPHARYVVFDIICIDVTLIPMCATISNYDYNKYIYNYMKYTENYM